MTRKNKLLKLFTLEEKKIKQSSNLLVHFIC